MKKTLFTLLVVLLAGISGAQTTKKLAFMFTHKGYNQNTGLRINPQTSKVLEIDVDFGDGQITTHSANYNNPGSPIILPGMPNGDTVKVYLEDPAEIRMIHTGTGVSWINLSALTDLKYFVSQANSMEELDVSKNTKLEDLGITLTSLAEIDLSKNAELRTLSIGGKTTSLDLRGCPKLQKLTGSSHCRLANVDLSNCPELQTFDIAVSDIISLDFSNCPKIENIFCHRSKIEELILTNHPNLKILNCSSNEIEKLNLKDCPEIIAIDCSYNKITNLDVSKNLKLETLGCSDNQLSKLDITNNTLLTKLTSNQNPHPTVDISNNTKLKYFSCLNTQVSSMDFSKNTELTEIKCGYSQLTKINISNNQKLETLDCSGNKLSGIDVSKNTALTTLDCRSNLLTDINVSKNSILRFFHCEDNYLTRIDISQNPNIHSFYCGNNRLNFNTLHTFTNPQMSYSYGNQRPVEIDEHYNLNTSIDLSHTGATAYRWFTNKGSELIEITDYFNHDGIFSFKNGGPDSAYCEMKNPLYPNLTLKTTLTHIDSPLQSIDEQQSTIKVEGQPGAICITTDNPLAYNVRTLSGIAIAKGIAQGETLVSTPQGIYIVQVGDETHKVIVR